MSCFSTSTPGVGTVGFLLVGHSRLTYPKHLAEFTNELFLPTRRACRTDSHFGSVNYGQRQALIRPANSRLRAYVEEEYLQPTRKLRPVNHGRKITAAQTSNLKQTSCKRLCPIGTRAKQVATRGLTRVKKTFFVVRVSGRRARTNNLQQKIRSWGHN